MAGEREKFYNLPEGISDQVVPYVPMGSDKAEDAVYLSEYTALRKQFSQYHANMADDERFYRLEFGNDFIPKEWRQKGFDATLPPTAYNAVEAATNHLLTTPDILVPERPGEPDVLVEQEIAAIKATGLSYFWHQAFKQGDPLGHGKKDAIKHGRIVLKKEILPEALAPTGVSIGRRRFPWRVTHLSPGQVMEIGPYYDPTCVYESSEMTRSEAERLFPEAKGDWLTTKESLDKVRVLEYWEKPRDQSRGKRIIWIDDERVLNKINPYNWVEGMTDRGQPIYCGYVPYFISDSGWGDGDIDAAPHERFVGMVRRIHSLLLTEARQLTAADAQLRISTFPILKLKNIEEDDEHPIQLGPGAKIHIDDTQDVEPVAWPSLDRGVFALLQQSHSYLNELSQFEQLSGIPQSGVDSATEADQNMRAASSKLAGVLAGLKSLIMRINETVLQDIFYLFEDTVSLYGATEGMPGTVDIRPEWIDGFWENFVELKTSDSRQLDAAAAMQWANLYQVFGLDRRYAMKMAGISNPPQRIAQRMQEDIWFDPRSHEVRWAATMQGQGGETGQMLAQAAVNALATGNLPGATQGTASGATAPESPQAAAGGSFAGPPIGEPSARNNPQAEPESPVGQDARATGFATALARRPELPYGGA